MLRQLKSCLFFKMSRPPVSMNSSVKELAEKYRTEFEETYKIFQHTSMELTDHLQNRIYDIFDKIQSIKPEIKQHRHQIIECIQKMVILN